MENERKVAVSLASESTIPYALDGISPDNGLSLRSRRKFGFIALVYGGAIAMVVLVSVACDNSQSPADTLLHPTFAPISNTLVETPLVLLPPDKNGDSFIDMRDARDEYGPDWKPQYDMDGQSIEGSNELFDVDDNDARILGAQVCTIPVSLPGLHKLDVDDDGHVTPRDRRLVENYRGEYEADTKPGIKVPLDALWRGIPVVNGKPDLSHSQPQTDGAIPDPLCDNTELEKS